MNFPDFLQLRKQADHSLAQSDNPKGMILFHTGMVLLLAALVTIVDYFLERAIGSTGGLGGMAMRSMLTTAQSVLHIVQGIALPFWQIGYTFYTLQVAQNKHVEYRTFGEGFRRFGAVLRLNLFTGAIYMAVTMVATYVSSFLFLMSPWGSSVLEPIYQASAGGAMDPEMMAQLIDSISVETTLPIFLIFIPCFLLLCAPFFYRYRMAQYWLMDHPQGGALAAMHNSRKLMQGKRLALFRMDLKFWWFYLLDLLVTAICYGDLLLNYLGIKLPIPEEIAYLPFFGIYLICQLGLYYWKRNEVGVTYAHLYLSLTEPQAAEAPQNPGKQPWVY
jgi:uncharacterized membrane protein